MPVLQSLPEFEATIDFSEGIAQKRRGQRPPFNQLSINQEPMKKNEPV
jgi:hypothetical protein